MKSIVPCSQAKSSSAATRAEARKRSDLWSFPERNKLFFGRADELGTTRQQNLHSSAEQLKAPQADLAPSGATTLKLLFGSVRASSKKLYLPKTDR